MLKKILKELKNFSEWDLFELRVMIDAELQDRGISLDVGLLGEKYCIRHFNETPGLSNLLQAPTGAKNVDALSRVGDRYSIKTFKKAKKTGTIYPDEHDSDKQLFEYLVVVKLDELYRLCAIYRYKWEDFLDIRAWDKRMNAWYVSLSQKNLEKAEILYQAEKLD